MALANRLLLRKPLHMPFDSFDPAVERRDPESGMAGKEDRDMTTDRCLRGSEKVQQLQRVCHAKATGRSAKDAVRRLHR